MTGGRWVAAGGVLGFLAVLAGAFGAHLLERYLSVGSLEIYEVGARYHLAHAVCLVLVGLLAPGAAQCRLLNAAGWAFLIGTLIFSGSLYGLAASGWTMLGAITPLGGLGLLCGWALLAAHGLRERRVATPPGSVATQASEKKLGTQ